MDISIVIVNWNTRDLLLDCLTSIYRYVEDCDFEVFVVDNGSVDDSVAAVRAKYPEVKIIQNETNLGFAAANNKAFKVMKGRYCLMLNTDTILTYGAVDQLYSFIEEHQGVGMVCGQLLNEDGSRQNSIANFPTIFAMLANETVLRILLPRRFPSKRRDFLKPIKVDSCIGACILVRRTAMDDVGLLDEKYFFYFEETDWAYRMWKKNWQVFFLPSAKIFHLQGQTATYSAKTRIMFYRSRSIFFKKWYPHKHGLMVATVFFRLWIDIGLNIIHYLFSFGLSQDARQKIKVYSQLILWHFNGCPDNQ